MKMKCSNQVCTYKYVGEKPVKFCSDCGKPMIADTTVNLEPISFSLRNNMIELHDLHANIFISFHASDSIVVKIEGDSEIKDAILVENTQQKVVIKGKLPDVEQLDKYSSVRVHDDGSIRVDGVILDPKKMLKIEITLPWISEISFNKFTFGLIVFADENGNLKFGNSGYMNAIGGNFQSLNYSLAGTADLVVGDIKDKLACSVSGEGGVTARNISGPTSFNVSGDAKIGYNELKGNLNISVEGSSDIRFDSLQGNLVYSLSGDGNLEITKAVMGKCNINIAGDGTIKVLSGAIGELSASIVGSGNMMFNLPVVKGSYSIIGEGDIHTLACQRITTRNIIGAGSIKFG